MLTQVPEGGQRVDAFRAGRHPASRRSGQWLPQACFWMVLLLLASNLLAFVAKAANPLVTSDTWHFIDAVVRPYATGTFEVGDLFFKRNALDHSQPLRKLISLLNYEWFDLDLRIEGLIGAAFALLNLCVLGAMCRAAQGTRAVPTGSGFLFLGLAAVYLSIGEPGVLTWPLVTLNYTTHLFVFLHAWAAWRVLQQPTRPRLATLFLTGFTLAVVADDTGLIATLAVVGAAAAWAVRQRRPRAAVPAIVAAIAGYVAYAVLYRALSAPQDASPFVLGEALARLGALAPDAWKWIAVPLAASVVHKRLLVEWTGHGGWWWVIAAALVVAHGWFWYVALSRRNRDNALVLTATISMLLFYGLVAGIVVARVSEFGSDYLWQPRYALIYRWNLVALLLMALGTRAGGENPDTRVRWPVPLAAGILLLQFPLAVAAWKTVPYVLRYQRQEAAQIGALAMHPESLPDRCMPTVVVCRFPEPRRKATLGFLARQKLNVFSPAVQARNGLRP